MQVYRCVICGDPYIGSEKPSHCPFCGAHQKYLIEAKDWQDRNNVVLSDISRSNLEGALRLEVNNSDFYKKAFAVAKDPYFQALFKALSKIEAEHASVIVKLLKVTPPQPDHVLPALETEKDFLALAHSKEQNAVAFYQKSADEATEERVKEVFTALVEIEADHIKLSQ